MRWAALFITVLIDVTIVRCAGFMHSSHAIISFFTAALFPGLIVQESGEDIPVRRKQLISGFMPGTYAAIPVISFLIYKNYILLT
jgi:hypothetical protein